jgi:hypothetical protein
MKWAGQTACMRKPRNVYKILVAKPEGKRAFIRHRHRWEDNIKMDLREIGLEGVKWVHMVQDRDCWWALGSYEHSNKPSSSIKGRKFLDLLRTLLHVVSELVSQLVATKDIHR